MNSASRGRPWCPIKTERRTARSCCATWPTSTRRHHAGRIRPLQHEPAGEHDGQHRGRGPGPGRRAHVDQAIAAAGRAAARRRRWRCAARWRRWSRCSAAWRSAWRLAVVVDLPAADGLFPVAAAGARRRWRRRRRCIAGVAVALLATGTTLNIQSFMGAIMAVGVAVANAILLVTFAERRRRAGRRGRGRRGRRARTGCGRS